MVKEKQCLKSLEKFRDSVKEKIPETPVEENENQNAAMETEQTMETEPTDLPNTTQQEGDKLSYTLFAIYL